MKYGNILIDEEKYTEEEWERIGIEADSRFGLINVRVHKVPGEERTEMCFHTVCTFYDPERQENTGVIEILRQKWDAGGYYLKPESKARKVTKSDLSQDQGHDPYIGRLP